MAIKFILGRRLFFIGKVSNFTTYSLTDCLRLV